MGTLIQRCIETARRLLLSMTVASQDTDHPSLHFCPLVPHESTGSSDVGRAVVEERRLRFLARELQEVLLPTQQETEVSPRGTTTRTALARTLASGAFLTEIFGGAGGSASCLGALSWTGGVFSSSFVR